MANSININPIDLESDVAVGIAYPISYKTGAPNGKNFILTYTTLDQAKSNLIMVLLTNEGERIMHPDFGCSIRKFLFEQIDTTLISKIENKIREQVSKWLPYILIKNLNIEPKTDNHIISIKIDFALEYNKFDTATITLNIPIPE